MQALKVFLFNLLPDYHTQRKNRLRQRLLLIREQMFLHEPELNNPAIHDYLLAYNLLRAELERLGIGDWDRKTMNEMIRRKIELRKKQK